MTLSDSLAAESMRQLLEAMKQLPDDTPLAQRLKLIAAASTLLERLEVKTASVSRLGDHPEQGMPESPA